MNLGLGTLAELKRQLLASSKQSDTSYDAKLQATGSGVAIGFEKYCNRQFFRAVADVFQFPADRDHVFVPRYPIDAAVDGSPVVTAVDYRSTVQEGWVAQSLTVIANVSAKSGGIYFVGPFGYWNQFVRVTYTGGFWFDITEDASGTQPAGSTALPSDLKLAWYLQCRKVWESIDKTGAAITKVGSGATFVTESLGGLDLVPAVKQVLDQYRRFAIT